MSYGDGYAGGYGGGGVDGISVLIDWAKSGTYTDESVRVLRRGSLTVQYGRDQTTALAPTVAGTGSLLLDNASKRYSSRNTGSPLYGNLKPARPVRINREVGGTTYTLFAGHTDDSPISPDPNSKDVSVSLVDSLADFRGQNLSTQLYSGLHTGDAIGKILDACGWPADLRDLDPGATVIPWWWEDGTDALTALDKVLRSEGPPAMLFVGVDGEIVFRDRHHRLLSPASLTSQQTWVDTGAGGVVMNKPFSLNEGWDNIINTGTAEVGVRIPGPLQEVWTSDATYTFTAGEQKLVTASTSDPFYGAVPPVSGTDYTVHSGNVTATLLRTSGGSTTIVLTAIAAVAIISGLRLRAYPVPVGYTTQISASDSQSLNDYGSRSFSGDLPWCNPYDAEAVLRTAVAQRSQPLPIVSARFLVGNNTGKIPVLARDLGDRVTVVEPETVTNGDFYIEAIAHELTSTFDHAVTFGLEAAPVTVSPIFRFDVAGQGFNDGKFGSGLDDPATMFQFSGTTGHRFNEGVFAT